MKQSATKAKLEENSISVTKTKTASKFLHQILNKGKQRSKCHLILRRLAVAALYAKVTTGYGSVGFSKK